MTNFSNYRNNSSNSYGNKNGMTTGIISKTTMSRAKKQGLFMCLMGAVKWWVLGDGPDKL